MLSVTSTIYYLVIIISIGYEIHRNFISPTLIFLGMQFIMYSGLLLYSNYTIDSDILLIGLYQIALIGFLCGKYIGDQILYINNKPIYDYRLLSDGEIQRILLVIIGSMIVSFIFFLKVKNNVIISVIKAILQGAEIPNLSQIRKIINFSPGNGFVYQFRMFFLPISNAYLITFEKGNIRKLGYVLFPVTIILLLGSGQRAGFVQFLIVWTISILLYMRFSDESKKRILKVIFKIFIIGIPLFLIFTIANGRVEGSGSLINAIVDRALRDNQLSAIYGFRYIYEQPTQYGRDWFYMIKNIFGENLYQAIAFKIHEILWGSITGTAPPCLWGSTYYNFGFLGVPFVSALIGLISSFLYTVFINNIIFPFRIMIFAGIFTYWGMWCADGPDQLLNAGFLAVILLGFFVSPNNKSIKLI